MALSLASVAGFAQEEATGEALVGRKGTPILPKAGDIAIGVEATPYLNYFGNMFNGYTGDNNFDNYLNSNQIYGRYYIADDAAIRARLRITDYTSTSEYYIQDDAAIMKNPLSNAQTVDKYTQKYSSYLVGVGYQKFRGYGRLRGFYGAEVTLGYNKGTNYEYAYGNPISSLNTNPSSTNHLGNVSNGVRTLESKNGSTTSLGINALAGVEYYFAPKICIGGELGLGYNYSSTGQNSSKVERWNGTSVVEEVPPLSYGGGSYSSFSTLRQATFGSLYVMFHF